MKRFVILLFAALQLLALSPFEEAMQLYKKGRYATALQQFKTLATAHEDPDAAHMLGYMYMHGQGCTADPQIADQWYARSSRLYFIQGKGTNDWGAQKAFEDIFHSFEPSSAPQTEANIRQLSESLYNLTAHRSNYLLPVSHRFGGAYASTPTQTPKQTEVEFQISIKFNIATNVLGLDEIYSVAYTQLSFWQFYVDSAYFRESNYNPEFFITVPMPGSYRESNLKAFRITVAHESNGRGGAMERSWNYLSGSVFGEFGPLFSELTLWTRLPDTRDYNPDLLDYLGHGQLRFMLPYEAHYVSMMLRSNLYDHSAVEVAYSYPFFGRNDLFWYVKGFSGYGESLIDYDHYVNKLGIGFSISR